MLLMGWLLMVRSRGKIRMGMKLRIGLLTSVAEGNLNILSMPESESKMLQIIGTPLPVNYQDVSLLLL